MNIKEYLKDFSEEEKQKFWDEHYNSNRVYDEFMAQYNIDHECCPECGETSHMSTLVGYIFNHDSPETYKDLNNCTCKCGSIHTTHERVFKKLKDGKTNKNETKGNIKI